MNRKLLIPSLIAALFTLTINLGVFLVPVYSTSVLRLPEAKIGLLVGMPGLLAVLFLLPAATLANRLGRKNVILLSGVCSISAALLILTSRSFGQVVAAQLMFGVANATFWPAVIAYFSELAQEPAAQAKVQSVNTTAQGIGLIIGPLLAGLLVRYWGFQSAMWVWLLAASLNFVLSTQLIATPQAKQKIRLGPAIKSTVAKVPRILSQPALVITGASQLLTAAFITSVGGAFFILFTQDVGYAAAAASVMLSVREVFGTLSRLLYPRLSKVIPNLLLLSLVAPIAALALLVGFWYPVPVVLFLVVAVEGFALGVNAPAGNTVAAENSAPEDLAETIATVVLMFQLGSLIFPSLTGFLIRMTSLKAGVALTTAFVGLVSLSLLFATVKQIRQESLSSQKRLAKTV